MAKQDIDIIDELLAALYDNGEYRTYSRQSVVEKFQPDVHEQDINRIVKRLMYGNVLNYDRHIVGLSDRGMELMREHGSYTAYLANINYKEPPEPLKKWPQERVDRWIRHFNTFGLLAVAITTVIVSIATLKNSRRDSRIEEGIQSIQSGFDSLRLELKTLRLQIESQSKSPIDTSK